MIFNKNCYHICNKHKEVCMKIYSFDIGVASIGWAFIENDELKDCGVRSSPKQKIQKPEPP